MNWYYAIANDRRGPIDQQQLEALVRQGVITHQTLVWREGMQNWQPYASVAPLQSMPAVSISGGARPAAGWENCGLCGAAVPSSDLVAIGEKKYCAACKPLVVQRIKEGVSVGSDAEEIRRQYIKHEASVKSIGILYYLGGTAIVIGSISMGGLMSARSGDGEGIIFTVVMAILGLLALFVGWGIRRLKKWVKIPVGLISGLGLLNIPIGTLIHGYILYLVFSQKGKMVLSDEYKAIIAQTPHVKYRSSPILVALLVIIIVFILIAVGAALLSGR